MHTLARLALAALLLLTLAPTTRAQSIKYEKYTLDNGLTVILHEDHALPMVTVNLWYRVGAKEEQAGRSGFAHLFEHLMFMGTKRVPGSDFDVIMESGGGSNNASTSLDRTNYFSSGPSSLLPTLLWLDADRLEDLGRTMNQEKLDKQRDVVRNEIRQQVENTPYAKSEEFIYRIMYPKGHPYHEAVYGTHEDLEAATVWNVKDFFATFYVPNNCSLVVAGDFETAKVKPLIQSLFGSLPRGGAVVRREPKDWPTPRLARVERLTMLDQVELPRVFITYHSPAMFGPGDADMDLIGAILTQGKSSRLYKRLILDDKIASDVSAIQNSSTLGSLFHIVVTTAPDADLDKVERAIDEEIARLVKDGPTADELSQRQSTVEMAMLARTDSLLGKADKLNEYEYFFGEPDSFQRDLDRYRNATPASIKEWAGKTFTQDSRAIIRILPQEPEQAESGRDQRPDDFALAAFKVPEPQSFTLGNGTKVMVWPRPGGGVPLVAASVLVQPKGGGALVGNDKAGLAALTADMLDEGAGDRDAVQFADAMQAIGADFGAGADYESFTAGVTVLKRNFDKAAALLADAVQRPRMTESDFERVHRLHMDDLEQSLSNPQVVAGRAAMRALLGDQNAYAIPTDGLVETAGKVTLSDIKQLHAAAFAPANATILVSGDITVDEAKSTLERAFGDWKAAGAEMPASAQANFDIPGGGDTLRVFIVDRPEAVQTVIRFSMPGVQLASPMRPTYETLNTLFGGSFTSRLNQNLREKNGFTYGARSRFSMMNRAGVFSAYSAVKADTTGAALNEFLGEIKRLRDGDVSDDEAAKAARTVRTDTIQSMEGVHGPIGAAAPLLSAGLPYSTIGVDLIKVATLKASDLNSAARNAIPMERGVLVLVGDKKLILDQIKELNLPEPVELTPEGARIK